MQLDPRTRPIGPNSPDLAILGDKIRPLPPNPSTAGGERRKRPLETGPRDADQHSPACLVLAPAARNVRLAERSDVAGLVVDHSEAV